MGDTRSVPPDEPVKEVFFTVYIIFQLWQIRRFSHNVEKTKSFTLKIHCFPMHILSRPVLIALKIG
jgi:hypothetical protein